MLERLVGAGLAGLWLLLLLQVLARYLLPVAPAWTEEIARLVFVYLTFGAATVALGKGANMQVTTLVDRLSPAARRAVRVAVNLGSSVFLLVVFAWSFVVIAESWALPLPASDLPTALFMLPVPVGAALMLRHVVQQLRRDLARPD